MTEDRLRELISLLGGWRNLTAVDVANEAFRLRTVLQKVIAMVHGDLRGCDGIPADQVPDPRHVTSEEIVEQLILFLVDQPDGTPAPALAVAPDRRLYETPNVTPSRDQDGFWNFQGVVPLSCSINDAPLGAGMQVEFQGVFPDGDSMEVRYTIRATEEVPAAEPKPDVPSPVSASMAHRRDRRRFWRSVLGNPEVTCVADFGSAKPRNR